MLLGLEGRKMIVYFVFGGWSDLGFSMTPFVFMKNRKEHVIIILEQRGMTRFNATRILSLLLTEITRISVAFRIQNSLYL